jgi:hypothetical protein
MILSSIDRMLASRRDVLSAATGATAAALFGIGSARAALATPTFGDKFDPLKAEHNTLAFCKMLADIRDKSVSCGYFKGQVLAYVGPSKPLQPLFGYEGFGLTTVNYVGDFHWQKLHKEVAYYTDLKSGDILETWDNPLSGEKVEVLPVYNDPVNSNWAPTYSFGVGDKKVTYPFVFPWFLGDDAAVVDFGVNTTHTAALLPDKWPRESHGPVTQVYEAIQVHARLSELMDPARTSVYPSASWQRIAPYLPWMLMGQAPGHLVYKTTTRKLKNGVDGLPRNVRDYTARKLPKYLEPLREWTGPNVSSFEVYARDRKPAPQKPQG